MRSVKTIMIYIIVSISLASAADTTTVILQNGVDSYTGCEDTYTYTQEPNTPHSTNEELLSYNCRT